MEEKQKKHEELSDIWQELLGSRLAEEQEGKPINDIVIPMLASDPWSALIQAKGVEVVEQNKHRLHISDQEVELMLEVMQEQKKEQDASQ